jgi:hypothetical protein
MVQPCILISTIEQNETFKTTEIKVHCGSKFSTSPFRSNTSLLPCYHSQSRPIEVPIAILKYLGFNWSNSQGQQKQTRAISAIQDVLPNFGHHKNHFVAPASHGQLQIMVSIHFTLKKKC